MPFKDIQSGATSSLRYEFVKNAANFISHYKFDGMDMSWDYIEQRYAIVVDFSARKSYKIDICN